MLHHQHRDVWEKQTTFCREVTAGVMRSSAFICQHSWSSLVSVSLISIDTSRELENCSFLVSVVSWQSPPSALTVSSTATSLPPGRADQGCLQDQIKASFLPVASDQPACASWSRVPWLSLVLARENPEPFSGHCSSHSWVLARSQL